MFDLLHFVVMFDLFLLIVILYLLSIMQIQSLLSNACVQCNNNRCLYKYWMINVITALPYELQQHSGSTANHLLSP